MAQFPTDGYIRLAQFIGYLGVPTAGASPLAITCSSPPSGQFGAPYAHLFPISGGAGPFSSVIIAGALPPGLSLDPSTSIASGVPLYPVGLFGFTIQVTDSLGATATVTCLILTTTIGVSITLRGVKRIRCTPVDDPATVEDLPQLPHVKRAV